MNERARFTAYAQFVCSGCFLLQLIQSSLFPAISLKIGANLKAEAVSERRLFPHSGHFAFFKTGKFKMKAPRRNGMVIHGERVITAKTKPQRKSAS